MAEWSNAAVLKTVDRASGPGVRIPLSPPPPAIVTDANRDEGGLFFYPISFCNSATRATADRSA